MNTYKWRPLVGMFLGTGLALLLCTGAAMAQETNCTDGLDNDGDKLIDCKDSDCSADAACKPSGTGCSPGFYKNHLDFWVGSCCTDVSDPTCAELNTALTCKGSDASCGRSAAAAFLDACTGCSE